MDEVSNNVSDVDNKMQSIGQATAGSIVPGDSKPNTNRYENSRNIVVDTKKNDTHEERRPTGE
jgi:hypothetical protein